MAHTRPDGRTRGAAWLPGLLLLALFATGSGAAAGADSIPPRGAAQPPAAPIAAPQVESQVREPSPEVRLRDRDPAADQRRLAHADREPGHGDSTRFSRLPQTRPSRPRTVVVPRLGVRAPVKPIATVNRALIPPSDPQVIGWWADGAKPGASTGSAVLTGHTVHTGGGAFDDLDQLRPGDAVAIGTAYRPLRYVVREVRNYPKASLAAHAADVFSQEVPGRLVLITCEDWNGTGYDSNAVVVAEPVS